MEACFASREPLLFLKLVVSYKIFFTLELSFELYFYVINELLKGPGCVSRLQKCELSWGREATVELQKHSLQKSWSRGVCAHTPFPQFAGTKRLDIVVKGKMELRGAHTRTLLRVCQPGYVMLEAIHCPHFPFILS